MANRGVDVIERRDDRRRAIGRNVPRDAARNDAIHHQPVAEGTVRRGEHALAENPAMGMDQGKGRVVADRADIAEMIGDALKLRHHPAQHDGARRHSNVKRGFDGAREGKAERHRRIPGDPRDDARRLVEIDVGQEAVDALVHIAEPLLEPRHGLAIGGEAEMPRLDDAGMDRTDGNLMEPVAVHRQEFVIHGIARRRRAACPERRANAPLAVIEPGTLVGRIGGHMAVEIAHGAFETDRRQMKPADRRKAAGRDGKRHDARRGRGRADRHVYRAGIAP